MQSHKMYNDTNFNYKLKSLILMMNKQIKKDKKMVLIVSPQFLDLKSKYLKYSQNFFLDSQKKFCALTYLSILSKRIIINFILKINMVVILIKLVINIFQKLY